MAIRLEVKKNFFYITNTFDNHTKRMPLRDSAYEVSSDNQTISFISPSGIRQSVQTYYINNLVDKDNLPFLTFDDLEDFLNTNLYLYTL